MTKNYNINGVLLLDKPVGISSHFATQQVKKFFQAKKAGHTGSLDVLANGMLPICLGEATKFSQYLLDANKHYLVEGCLGRETTTYDANGDIVVQKPYHHITSSQLMQVLSQWQGKVEQVPPLFSAIKHQGQPLYKLARRGIAITPKARCVIIYKLQLLTFNLPFFTLMVHCSKGTYIRSIVHDVGQGLACGAYVTSLRRTTVAHYQSSQMLTLATLHAKALLAIDTMVSSYHSLTLSDAQTQALYLGQRVKLDSDFVGLVRLYNGHDFIGMGQLEHNQLLKAVRLLAPSNVS